MTYGKINFEMLVNGLERTSFGLQIGIASIVSLIFIFIAYLALLPDLFFGEEFFIFHYADTFNHWQAWQLYFIQNGRLLEGVYWTYIYKIVGFEPTIIRMLSITLHLIATILASVAILRSWTNKPRWELTAFFLPLFLFLNPISLDLSFRISLDNSRIALILFWLSVIALQQWAISSMKIKWYILSLILYVFALTTYENVILLFPAGIIFAWPLFYKEENKLTKKDIAKYILGALLGTGLFVAPLVVNSYIQQVTGVPVQHPAIGILDATFGELIPASIKNVLSLMIGFGAVAFNRNALLVSIIFILIVVATLNLLWDKWKNFDTKIKYRVLFTEPTLYIFLASVWIMVIGFAPYAIAGYAPTLRVYSSAIFGIIPILLLIVERSSTETQKYLILLALTITSIFSIYRFSEAANDLNSVEAQYVDNYLQIKQLIPNSKDQTNFILLNFRLNGASCGPSLNMLYANKKMNCITLGISDETYLATRHKGAIEGMFGGWSRYENDIILGIDPTGKLILIPEINSDDGLLIEWESNDPILTDFKRITYDEINTPFYNHLLERNEALGLQGP